MRRDKEAIEERRSSNAHGDPGDTCLIHVLGAHGEYAASKVLGVAWLALLGVYKKRADLGQNVEVRTRRKRHWDLIVRTDDVFSRYFVLVTGQAPVFFVHGWIHGEDACRNEWWKTYTAGRSESWFVPQDFLQDISTLKPLIIL
jgi:hypothetical protein